MDESRIKPFEDERIRSAWNEENDSLMSLTLNNSYVSSS